MNFLYPIVTGIILAMFTNICFSEDDLLILDDNIKVITPTKLLQSLYDTPSSVTIISKSDMTRLGIKTVPEALRLVPGMAVTQASGNDYRISYHGTNGVAPRRMQVLIDGVSIYRFGIAQIDWAQIPILADQIERIEVTRSPAGTTYGANSFFAVVNIITKHPADSKNFSTEITAGSLNTKITSLYFGDSIAETDYRIAASIEKSDGYDENFRGNDREDASDINRYNWRSSSQLNNKAEFNTSFSYVNSYLENEFSDAFQITSPNIRAEDYYASTELTYDFSDNNEFKIELSYLSSKHTQKWTTCPPTFFWLPELRSLQIANPELAQTLVAGQTPSSIPAEDQQLVNNLLTRLASLGASATQSLCGDLNQNYKDEKLTIEAHDTYLITNNLRAVSGLSFTRSEFTSETYVGGRKKRNRGYFMTNIEYKPNKKLVFNIGGILEHEEKLKDNLYPSTLLAVNYHMTSEQTIRFSNSTAIRTPDLLENDRNWNYLGRNLERSVNGSTEQFIYVQKISVVDLEPEETISTEIAYHANFINYGLNIARILVISAPYCKSWAREYTHWSTKTQCEKAYDKALYPSDPGRKIPYSSV